MAKGLGNMMKQAQQMQQKMARIQEEVAKQEIEASAGGGMVTAVVNGKQEVLAIKIDPSVVDPQDVDMLQDLILVATNEAIRQSQELMQQEMSKLTGGMNIPGLF
ncbi:MAG: YbaB/EbfC family nucleoid-associated protein [Desulfuromonas sp.]|jgi:DNA-binding YbaB/EbfC family protein|nr:MAG: YbaB/EbfC family nucleoid-associated protein [Desulfuromonas sp.]